MYCLAFCQVIYYNKMMMMNDDDDGLLVVVHIAYIPGVANLNGANAVFFRRCRVLSLSACKYSLNPLSQTRIDTE